ncbi:MAG TPA: hypothetical protein VD788_15600 [Candidatus Polarisedimenticolaceae bacterium]|nr:hypothetical protein [Candidatus Polarisedimenticolaceae bacterium]
MELSTEHPLFVGFQIDGSLRRQIEALSGPERRYVSSDDSTFLMMCRKGDDVYVGKLIEDGLTTDRVDDVRRNVLSIMRRLCPDVRLPNHLEIWPTARAGSEPSGQPPDPSAPRSLPREW